MLYSVKQKFVVDNKQPTNAPQYQRREKATKNELINHLLWFVHYYCDILYIIYNFMMMDWMM